VLNQTETPYAAAFLKQVVDQRTARNFWATANMVSSSSITSPHMRPAVPRLPRTFSSVVGRTMHTRATNGSGRCGFEKGVMGTAGIQLGPDRGREKKSDFSAR
jgi:hypothetical protein